MNDKTEKKLEALGPMSPETEDHMRRYLEPDGRCLHCGQPANQHHPVGPITVMIATPDEEDPVHEFCEWRCFARWVADAAGGWFVADRN
jgi:hypothetical protein